MPLAPFPENRLAFLAGCLVEGDSVQEARLRQRKRRALLLSILFQTLIVAALIVFPLFTKGENIASHVLAFPTVPYSLGRSAHHPQRPAQPSTASHPACHVCAPTSIPNTIATHVQNVTLGDPTLTDGVDVPGLPEGNPIPGTFTTIETHRQPPPPTQPPVKQRVRLSGQVIAAKLVHRIEPVYPALAVQTRREGRVELHAIIATDGSIQSLEVTSGDPFFILSALSAVRQWRYQPTLLNNQAVEVDTHITVIYTLAH